MSKEISTQEVVVTDVRMKFISMVVFMIKWAIALPPSQGFILIDDSKSGKSRKVPMNRAVFDTLKDQPKFPDSEFIFTNPETKTRLVNINKGFNTAKARAGIKGLRLHDLRHTAATWMIQAGIDLVTVSKILGHATIQMTMRYAHPTPENMCLAVERLGEIFDQERQKVASGVEVTLKQPHANGYRNYL